MAAENSTTQPPLTPASIEAARPGDRFVDLFDTAAPGLCLRITPRGTKVFRWYVTGAGRVITLGRFSKKDRPGHITLHQARARLEVLKEAHRAGRLEDLEPKKSRRDRASERSATSPATATPAGALTVRDVAKDFLKHLDGERRRPEQPRRVFDVEVLPELGDRLFNDVTREDLVELVKRISGRGSPVMANHTLALLRQFFTWAVDTKSGLRAPGLPKAKNVGARKAEKRERVLDPAEIAAFWKAVAAFKGFTPTVRHALHLLLLLGVRSGELRQATWDEFDLTEGLWVVPPEHQKEPQGPWKVPLPAKAVELLEELKALAKSVKSQHVLASFANGGEPLSEKAINHAMRRLFEAAEGETPALVFAGERPRPHDLRRTLRFHARQTLRVPFDVSEKLLGHSLGAIAGTYDPGDLFEERRSALQLWSAYVDRLVAGKDAKVVPLAEARAR